MWDRCALPALPALPALSQNLPYLQVADSLDRFVKSAPEGLLRSGKLLSEKVLPVAADLLFNAKAGAEASEAVSPRGPSTWRLLTIAADGQSTTCESDALMGLQTRFAQRYQAELHSESSGAAVVPSWSRCGPGLASTGIQTVLP